MPPLKDVPTCSPAFGGGWFIILTGAERWEGAGVSWCWSGSSQQMLCCKVSARQPFISQLQPCRGLRKSSWKQTQTSDKGADFRNHTCKNASAVA